MNEFAFIWALLLRNNNHSHIAHNEPTKVFTPVLQVAVVMWL